MIPNREEWNNYSNEPLKFYEVTGDHFSIFKLPETIEFAKIFDRVLTPAAMKGNHRITSMNCQKGLEKNINPLNLN